MNQALLQEIVETYEKYEWTLREILLAGNAKSDDKEKLAAKYKDVPIRFLKKDAAWFSRPSKNNHEAWELRLISEQPMALLETFPRDLDKPNLEKSRKEMETRLSNLTSKN